ncbi:ATP-binding protein [Saprospira grandis]|nr:ATP-binding protein [Saprospira grandis]
MPTPRFLHFFPETKYKAKLEETLLCLGSFWTMLICLTYWVLSFFYNYQEATSLGALLGGLAYLGLFLWIKFRAFSPWLSFIYILISLCLLDGLWMMVGGIYSDLPILLLLAFFTSMMISAKGWLWLAMLLNFSNFAFLLVLHLYFPESINYHPPAAEVAFTSFTSLGVALFSIWVLMGILKERYQLSQEQLEQKNMALIDASQAKSQFLAQMSHEIRTPMNGMLGMAQLLLDSPLSEEQQEYAQTLKQSGEQLLQIVNEILDYSKLEAGGWHLQEQEFELERSVEEAMNIAVSRALAKGLSLRYFPDAHLPDQLIGDATKIRQMLLNLLDNAIKFSHQGCISIYMSKLREEEDRVWVEFRLTDQGVGIPQAKQSDLFKEFSQLSNQQAHSNSGTGLGLAIVRQLAEQMGGQVGVDSEEGQGASFYFRLPLQKVASKSASLFKGKRLFLLSKNKDAARFFEAICQRWEMEYFQFWEPDASHEAVELGIIPAPDFVFFDSQLQDPTEILSWPCPQFLLLALGEERKLSRNFQAQLSAPLRPLRIKQLLLKQMSVVQEEKEEGPSLPWTNKRVLLAEDNKINQRLMQQVLERMGLKLHIVQNGQEALDFLAQEEVDLILMDLQMPILDGRKASQAIRAQQINTPIIALSGEEEKAIEGINGFLQKPIELEQLEACLRQFFC